MVSNAMREYMRVPESQNKSTHQLLLERVDIGISSDLLQLQKIPLNSETDVKPWYAGQSSNFMFQPHLLFIINHIPTEGKNLMRSGSR